MKQSTFNRISLTALAVIVVVGIGLSTLIAGSVLILASFRAQAQAEKIACTTDSDCMRLNPGTFSLEAINK